VLPIGFNITIPESEIEFSFVRSSGPGGQNVNKVNSKAVLRWSLTQSPSLPEWMRARLLHRLGDQLTRTGEIIISSDRFRDQGKNREDCLEKLQAMLSSAAIPEKIRKATRPTFSSKRKTGEQKKRNSEKKKLRRSSGYDD
jgi:ribosome-associated protein